MPDRKPLRCRLFGHRWGAWIDGRWHEPNFGATAGALASVARCKRCPARWLDQKRPGLSLEQLAERVRGDDDA